VNDQDRTDLRAYLDGQAAELAEAITAGDTDRAEQIISHVGAEFSAEFAESIIPNLLTQQFEMLAEQAGQGDPEALRQLRRGLALIAGVPDAEAVPDSADGRAVVKYLNLGGALVTVLADHPADGEGPLSYWTRCTGCLATFGTGHAPETFHESRRLAARHAEECRALPQPTEPSGPDFRVLAHEYARKAADAIDGRGLTAVADKHRTEAAETYAGLAGVYAMLATAE
jgi:hypothetical protein